MLKIVKTKSDIKQHLQECISLKAPCIAVIFYRISARVVGHYSCVCSDPDEETNVSLHSRVSGLIDKYKDYIAVCSRDADIGLYTDINIKLPAAYQFAQGLDRLMYHVAGLEYVEPEQQEGYPVVYPIEILEHTIKVLCPYCGQVHSHGLDSYGGYYESHCLERSEDNHGYIIRRKDGA